MGEMRDSDWSRQNLLRSDWLGPSVATMTTVSKTHLADRSFPLYGSLNNRRKQINCFLLFPFQAEIDAFSF